MSGITIKAADRAVALSEPSTINAIIKEHYPEYKDALVASVDGVLADLSTVVSKDAALAFHRFDSEEGREVFWHSSSHILGNALVNLYGVKLVNGPPIADGFHCDFHLDRAISSHEFPAIEAEMQRIAKAKIRFERETLSKQQLLELYKDNEFKQYFINKFVEHESTIYKNGDYYDLCRGPHLNNTGYVKAAKLLKTSSVYFLNDATKPSLQRIYAVTFPAKEQLKEYLDNIERAKELDHRKIGKEMELFFFHKYSPGSCFWLPAGAHIYNKLMEFIRAEYRKRGFQEVITPNIFSTELWKESGHYDNYKENIYMVEKEDFALKPMNCPGHCVMFKNSEHSFKELPIRYADFGVLHRNELSGALTGLTRVRRFQQDDAHIFCRLDQVKDEISSCLDFLKYVYTVFSFKYTLLLSTRPEKYLGELSEWEAAEDALRNAIQEHGMAYQLNEGDGAFYGPKIDIILHDALGRKIQCATIQLDFQLPQRFKLRYAGSDSGEYQAPVMIHRAILGSLERMIAILIESFGKKLPFWLTPRQIAIVPLYAEDYADALRERLASFEVKIYNDSGCTLNKSIRNAEIAGYRFVCVVGQKERERGEINVRIGKINKNMPFADFLELVNTMVDKKQEYEAVFDLSNLKVSDQ
ncbi:threonyl-tRNA synthetase [Pancytospora philotis]|nr:threonyl-tRNA synthetase [Pancytospora philotis]